MSPTFDTARGWLLERATPAIVRAKLTAVAAMLNHRPALSHHLASRKGKQSTLQYLTWDGRDGVHVVLAGARMQVGSGPLQRADVTARFRSARAMRDFFDPEFNQLDLIVNNDVAIEGNLTILAHFGHMANSVTLGEGHSLPLHEARTGPVQPSCWRDLTIHPSGEPGEDCPEGEVEYLDDPHLADVTLEQLPRIRRLLWANRTTIPEVCSERARLITELKLKRPPPQNGGGAQALWQARALKHMLAGKRPIINHDDILAGTTTSKRIGVPVYPELGGTWLWSELLTSGARELNPYIIHDEDIEVLADRVFPEWVDDNVRQWAYANGGHADTIDLDMRLALYFMWKSQAASHTVADVPMALRRGLLDIQAEAARREADADEDDRRDFYRALQIALEGVMAYARHLARRASELSDEVPGDSEQARQRRAELREMARICKKVPAHPAETFHEAVQAIWILFIAQHMESFNAGMVLGRLDLWLEPYLRRELEGLDSAEERRQRIDTALELSCALMLKVTDNLPLKISAGNRIFSGSSGNEVITLGGLRDDGTSAVSDMTWLFLKATEMLHIRDPNMNARFAPGINSEAYLRRLCEVNLLTGATPSLHNDDAIVPALERQGFTTEHARDWTATGCVEPTSCGRHFGHTNCMMFNMVGALEMTLHNGVHPLIAEQVGPHTGDPRDFQTYDEFLRAFQEQLGWLIDRSVEANNSFGRAHQQLKPTPLLSALFEGPMESGKDVIEGGALYNTSGTAMVGLTDIVDSLAAVKTLVFEREELTFSELMEALEDDFEGHEALHAELLNKVPKFGKESGDGALPQQIADQLMQFVYNRYQHHEHYRGGKYVPGYWSMSYHVAFGELSGALPSGRKKGKAFTPGLTPSHVTGAPLTEQIRAVAALDALKMPNNIAFNVKVAPGGSDTHQAVIDRMAAYAGTFFELGGMQMQFNVVDSDTLRQAMADPDAYRDLLVRISGYNVYFVDLTPEAQLEVIERAEHSLAARG